MRILLVNYEYPPVGAGAGNATAHIARALSGLGHAPIVLTAAYASLPRRSTVDGITVVRVPALRKRPEQSNMMEMGTYVASAAVALPRLLRSERPDATIVFFSMPCGPLGLMARWWSGIPYVVSLRGGDVPGQERTLDRTYEVLAPIRRAVLRRAAAVVANSDGLAALSRSADPFDVRVIPNGVDSEFFTPAVHAAHRPFTFLFVGRFQAQKNLGFLVRAIAEAKRRTANPFRAVLIGDGPERANVQRSVAAEGLQGVVEIHGWCDKGQLLQHYQRADCFLNPSLAEGMPNAVLEAMACGLAVVATDVPGNDAVVSHGETGILVKLADLSQFANAMVSLLSDGPLAGRMGGAGRDQAVRRFSWESVARQYLTLFPHPGAAR